MAKSLYIRCSDETQALAHVLAKNENRSLTRQIIHMIHEEAKRKGIVLSKEEVKLGLQSLAETKSQANSNQLPNN
jgi:hypothetical protein